MAERIAAHMKAGGTKFIRNSVPSKLERPNGPDGKILVTWQDSNDANATQSEEYDTVLFAIGRYAVTSGLQLENAGVKCEKNGKFIVNEREQTNVENIYAIGDV